MAQRFLFGDSPSLPTPLDSSAFTEAIPSELFRRAQGPSAALAILPKADQAWRARHGDSYFGASYHTMLPSQWALQTLGFNFNVAMANHLKRALDVVSNMPRSRYRTRSASRSAVAREFHIPRAASAYPLLSTAAASS